MRTLLIAVSISALLSSAACSRQVVVQTSPAGVAEVSLKVTNRTPQTITVFVIAGGSETQLKTVAANATEIIPVRNVSAGTTVQLRATLADGSRSYTREGVVLSGVYEWQVP